MDQPSATSTTFTGPVGECLQAGTENAPVFDRPAPLRRFHDSGAGYRYPDLLTYSTPKFNHFYRVTPCPCLPCLVDSWHRKCVCELSCSQNDGQTSITDCIMHNLRLVELVITECTFLKCKFYSPHLTGSSCTWSTFVRQDVVYQLADGSIFCCVPLSIYLTFFNLPCPTATATTTA